MPYQSFKDLRVWQESKNMSVEIYKLTQNGKLSKDFGLRDQMQRAAVSVASNIAEGYQPVARQDYKPERALRRRLVVLQVEIVDLIDDLAVRKAQRQGVSAILVYRKGLLERVEDPTRNCP